MVINIQDKYSERELQPFVERLIDEHYNTIERLCVQAKKQTAKVSGLETHEVTSQYAMLCNNIIAETEQYIGMRKEKYIPYILQLSEKVTANHNCTSCSGGCKLNHDMQLLELKASNDLMKNMLNKLQIASLPLYSDTLYPEEYRVLRNQMALLENDLTELFFVENNYLFPKIIEAQKTINASN